jgi:hypothetical protein
MTLADPAAFFQAQTRGHRRRSFAFADRCQCACKPESIQPNRPKPDQQFSRPKQRIGFGTDELGAMSFRAFYGGRVSLQWVAFNFAFHRFGRSGRRIERILRRLDGFLF